MFDGYCSRDVCAIRHPGAVLWTCQHMASWFSGRWSEFEVPGRRRPQTAAGVGRLICVLHQSLSEGHLHRRQKYYIHSKLHLFIVFGSEAGPNPGTSVVKLSSVPVGDLSNCHYTMEPYG